MARNSQFVYAASAALMAFSHACTGQIAPSVSLNNPAEVNPAPELPIPSGPYGIGRVGFDWTDEKRRDRTSPDHPRELMVYFWYPAAQSTIHAHGVYLPGAAQMDARPEIQSRMRDEFGSRWPLIVSGAIYSHAVERAPAAMTGKKLPLVVFSHGNGSTTFNYTWLIEDLVSHGYIIAAIEHPGMALMVSFPDGRFFPFHQDAPPANASPAERMQAMMENMAAGISQGAEDVRFVLDRVTEISKAGGQQFPFKDQIDISRFAAMGHSAGAEVAARACQLDVRIKACVDLDGAMPPVAALPVYPDGAQMKQPLLFLEAYHPKTQMAGDPAQREAFLRKKEDQLRACPPGTYDVIIHSPGIAHPSFSDIPVLFAGRDGYPELKQVLHNADLIEKFVRAFLDKNFGTSPHASIFDTPPAEAEVVPYGRATEPQAQRSHQ
jgi:pimeloyl-ACP methyl ester carboxylesterase